MTLNPFGIFVVRLIFDTTGLAGCFCHQFVPGGGGRVCFAFDSRPGVWRL